jgi:methionine-rich copper-binding protein CopC
MSRARRAAIASLLLLPVLTAAALPPLRHLRLVKADPADGSTLTASPTAIRLWFSEPTEPKGSRITLTSGAGTALPLAPLARDAAADAPLVARLPQPLAAGDYQVAWRTMSADGHVVKGTLRFRVAGAR